MNIATRLNLPANAGTISIVDAQWGDTGKGKFVDAFSDWADIIARGTGGANAGHTISIGKDQYVFHLIPAGILRDRDGKTNIIGSGVAFDPRVFENEVNLLESHGLSYDHLRVSRNAHLVLPQHVVLDRLQEALRGGERIGTTGRGIGPVYSDRINRIGLTVLDMLNPDVFAAKLERNIAEKVRVLAQIDPDLVKRVMSHEDLENGAYYHPKTIFDQEAILERYRLRGAAIKDLVCDSDELLRGAQGKRKILLEGAQGVLLSVDHGIHPHVTSSDCSLAGLLSGVGLGGVTVDRAFAIVKAPYMTRVGEGVFPTEFGGEAAAAWCGSHGREDERSLAATVNSTDPFLQGVGVRIAGNEYGATTGRPRRTGWLDLPLLRYALPNAGTELILTKVDVMDACERIRICDAYEYAGPPYQLGKTTLSRGAVLDTAVPVNEVLRQVSPTYQEFRGWMTSLDGAATWGDLPPELKTVASFIAAGVKAKVAAISIGPDRDQTVCPE